MGIGERPPPRDIIWSPWRMEYIRSEKPDHCVFCEAAESDPAEDAQRFVVHRGTTHYVVLNIWPYNNGHAMVVPYRHAVDITDYTEQETLELFDLSSRLVTAYRRTMNAEGVNMGLNLGHVSGGSIDHLHMHLVPRWTGDANFMPVIGQTKVLVELLEETYARLVAEASTWPKVAD